MTDTQSKDFWDRHPRPRLRHRLHIVTDTQSKDFWDPRYSARDTPWDYGGTPPEFERYLRQQPSGLHLLIPGCGSAHELRRALELQQNPVGLDLSPQAVALARSRLGAAEEWRVTVGNFFTDALDPAGFDLIYERTFLCAIPPELREAYVKRVCQLLKPGGRLVGFFFYGEKPEPPPYPLVPGEEKRLFLPHFELIESHPSEAPLSFFEGMEQWQVWQKR